MPRSVPSGRRRRGLFGLLGQSSGAPAGAFEVGRAFGIPPATIFEANADRLGLLPLELCEAVVGFYGIRAAAEAVLNGADPLQRQLLLGWLLQTANSAPQSLMALDAFLERPVQEYGMVAEPTADLPVRNLRPLRPLDDVRERMPQPAACCHVADTAVAPSS